LRGATVLAARDYGVFRLRTTRCVIREPPVAATIFCPQPKLPGTKAGIRGVSTLVTPTSPPNQKGILMSVKPEKILYTAEAIVGGGRDGHGRTSDRRLDLKLSIPESMGGDGGEGTNPEQLFAVGYAACFQSALLGVAAGRGLNMSDSQITARVSIGPTGRGGFTLQALLDLHAPRVSYEDASELMARAHQRCPYSNATRGNIDVALTVDRKRLYVAPTPP
jgi:lipoyl-dependent peroxiredoxin